MKKELKLRDGDLPYAQIYIKTAYQLLGDGLVCGSDSLISDGMKYLGKGKTVLDRFIEIEEGDKSEKVEGDSVRPQVDSGQ